MEKFVKGINLIFFILSFCIWIFFLKWETMLGKENFDMIWQIAMPGYLIFVWIVIWYIISSLFIIKEERDAASNAKLYTKYFVIGLIIWVILAVIYIFYKK